MKRIIVKILLICIISISFYSLESKAASAGIVSTDKTVNSGENVTITVTSSQVLGSYAIELVDDGGLSIISASGGEVSIDQKKVTATSTTGTKSLANFTFKVPEVTEKKTYSVKFRATILEGPNLEEYEDVDNIAKITVNPKEEPAEGENNGEIPNTDNNEGNSQQNTTPETNYPTETKPQETQVQETPKSSNNYLKSLSVGTGTLTPEFYRETYEYTVEFGEDVNLYELANIELSAQTEDSRAKVEGTGTIDLVDGENSIKINVTAENGSVRTYTVKVIKPAKVEQSALRLTGLIINGINNEGEYQNIEFDLEPEVFEYNLTVPYAINSLSINPTTENEDIIIEVTGADSLIEGKNQVLIILTSPSDETIETTYTFNIERQAALIQEDNARDKRQTGIVIIGGIIGAILLLIIIVAIVKHIKKKKSLEENDEEYLEYEDGDENQDNDRNFMKYSKNDNEDDEEEDEQNYPFRGISKEKDLLERKNKNEEKEEQRMPTTDDIENPKLKWDDFINNDDEEDKSNNIKKKSKRGKRFM